MSNFLDHLERRFGNWAIPGLMKYLAILFVGVFLMSAVNPNFIETLDFNYPKIRSGEFWRIFTFIMAPNAIGFSPMAAIFMIFGTMLLFIFSDALEQQWGVFRSNLYIVWGYLSALGANFLFASSFGYSPSLSGIYLAMSILFAFATYNPRYTLLLFFVIPCPIWIIAALSAGFLLIGNITSPFNLLFIIICLSNYLIFALPMLLSGTKTSANNRSRRKKFTANSNEPLNTCHHCGANDISNPDLDFRVSSKDGETYCTTHLPK